MRIRGRDLAGQVLEARLEGTAVLELAQLRPVVQRGCTLQGLALLAAADECEASSLHRYTRLSARGECWMWLTTITSTY